MNSDWNGFRFKTTPLIAWGTFLFAWFVGKVNRLHHLQKTFRVYQNNTKHTTRSAIQRRKWTGRVWKRYRQRKWRKPRETCVEKSSVPFPPQHKSECAALFLLTDSTTPTQLQNKKAPSLYKRTGTMRAWTDKNHKVSVRVDLSARLQPRLKMCCRLTVYYHFLRDNYCLSQTFGSFIILPQTNQPTVTGQKGSDKRELSKKK